MNLVKIDNNRWEIPRTGEMKVSGRVYANDRLIGYLSKDKALLQVRNVATLPGIIGYSIGMPDIHEGYGFPIGGIAATDAATGYISPGGVGYDINCGVRLIKTNLFHRDCKKSPVLSDKSSIDKEQIKSISEQIFNTVPTGVGSQGAITKLSGGDLSNILMKGAHWAVENGFGSTGDLEHTEENGYMPNADTATVSDKACQRGLNQLGTLGSGNHFIELGIVQEIFDDKAASLLGLAEGQITLMIHSGSRGLGHQVCSDYLQLMKKEVRKQPANNRYTLPDPQLISVPLSSEIGQRYYSAMSAAANFAWANRQVMMSLCEKAIMKSLKLSSHDIGFTLIYDVCHNIAKVEDHTFDGEKMRLCVHRKGATRAFAPHHPLIPSVYRAIGQPVIIPGDMGRYSYLCLGTDLAMKETFGSSCHGAGRIMSRKQAVRSSTPNDVISDMKRRGIYVHSATKSTLCEEMSSAYKDVDDVVAIMTECGLLKKVVKLKPLAVIKG